MKRLFFIAAAVFAAMFLSGCSKEAVSNDDTGGEQDRVTEIVPAENSVVIDGNLYESLKSAENDILTFDSSVSQEGALSPGKIILAYEPSEKLPYGFMGKIVEVRENGGLLEVITEPAALEEAFDRFCVAETIDLVPETATKGTGFHVDKDGFYCYTQNLALESGMATASGEATLGFKLDFYIDVGKRVKNPMGHAILYAKASADSEFSMAVSSEYEEDVPLGLPLTLKTVHPVSIAIQPTLQLYLTFEASGSAGLNAGMSFSKQVVFAVEYKDGVWKAGGREMKPEGGADGDAGIDPLSLELELSGEVFEGLKMGLELRLLGMRNLKISLAPMLGFALEGNLAFDLSDSDLYSRYRDSKVTAALQLKAQGEADAGIFGKGAKWSYDFLCYNLLEQDLWLFPEFTLESLDTDENSASVAYSAERELFFPASVGTALYADRQPVAASDAVRYDYIKDKAFSFEHTYTGLQKDVSYLVCPYVQLGDVKIAAQPVDEFKIGEEKGKLIKSITFFENDQSAPSYSWIFQYDDFGRVAKALGGEDGYVIFEYSYEENRINCISDSEFPSWAILDDDGRILSINDGEVSVTLNYVDGYLYNVSDYPATTYTYEQGNLISLQYGDPSSDGEYDWVQCTYLDRENLSNIGIYSFDTYYPGYASEFVSVFPGIDSRQLLSGYKDERRFIVPNGTELYEIIEDVHETKYDYEFDEDGYILKMHIHVEGESTHYFNGDVEFFESQSDTWMQIEYY